MAVGGTGGAYKEQISNCFLLPARLDRDYRPVKEFFDELSRSGYVEGQNIIIEFSQPMEFERHLGTQLGQLAR